MKKALSLTALPSIGLVGALLCSLPITTRANGSARRIGTALIKLIEYSQYIGRNGLFYEPKCIASHILPLHENSEIKHTLRLSPKDTATIHITQTLLTQEALVAIKFYQQEMIGRKTITETTVTHLKHLDIDGGCVLEEVPGGVQYQYEQIEIRLSKNIDATQATSDSNEPQK